MEVTTASSCNNQLGHGSKVVEVASNGYILDEKALARILLRDDVKDLPVVVVSVAGPFRAGKSFLLNFFLRYLTAPEAARNESGDWLGGETEPLTGFSWRGGSERNTTGIDMWSEPYIATLPSGEKVAVLLMDTQGTFDSSSTVRDCSTIFGLSTLISSVLIYNIKENINEDDLQHLQLFAEYGRCLKQDDGEKAFQVLQFLVRDWPYDYEHAYGCKGGEELLALRMDETDNMPEELRKLRRQVRSCFEKIQCFLMANPGSNVRKKTFTGSLSEIDPEFKDCLRELVPSLLAPANLTPKLINGEPVKARDLFTYLKAYVEVFNSEDIVSPSSMAEATERAALMSAVAEARELYETRMERVTSPAQPSLTALALDDEHRKALADARAAFTSKKKIASKTQSVAYLAQMTRELQDHLVQYTMLNEGKLRKTIEEAKVSYEDAIRQVHGDKLLCLHPLDLEEVHNEAVQTALAVFDAHRRRIPKIPDLERIKFEKCLKEELEHLRSINEQHNELSAAAVRGQFSSNMDALLSMDPPLSGDAFEDKYKEFKAEALAEFEIKRNKPTQRPEDSYKDKLIENMAAKFVNLSLINKSKNRSAFHKVIDYYNTKMQEYWHRDELCVHPADLMAQHRRIKREALYFFPSASEQVDEDILSGILQSKYYEYKEKNDTLNNMAVTAGLRKYITEMNAKCEASWWWLAVVPMIVNLLDRNSYHRQSRSAALSVFNSKRRDTDCTEHDVYLQNLEDRMIDVSGRYM